MNEKDEENKTKADEVHISDGFAKMHKVAEKLTEEELNQIAEDAKKAAEDAQKLRRH
jgi:hypothetical protein